MIHESVYELRAQLKNVVGVAKGKVEILDAEKLRTSAIDVLVRDAIFGTEPVKAFSRWLIWEMGQMLGARPASIHEFYIARSRGEWRDRTVPAMNIRFTTYDTVRAALRAAQKTNTGAMIFEIARSEMSYTEQRPEEYTTAVVAAAIKEVLAACALKMPQLAMPVRVLVMGTAQTPSLDAVLELCDREKVLQRLQTT
jgi:glutamyl/glutaminyl-tRNA synthetase